MQSGDLEEREEVIQTVLTMAGVNDKDLKNEELKASVENILKSFDLDQKVDLNQKDLISR